MDPGNAFPYDILIIGSYKLFCQKLILFESIPFWSFSIISFSSSSVSDIFFWVNPFLGLAKTNMDFILEVKQFRMNQNFRRHDVLLPIDTVAW